MCVCLISRLLLTLMESLCSYKKVSHTPGMTHAKGTDHGLEQGTGSPAPSNRNSTRQHIQRWGHWAIFSMADVGDEERNLLGHNGWATSSSLSTLP